MGSLKKRASFDLLSRFLNLRISSLFRLTITRSLETLAFEEIRSSPDKPYNHTAFVLHGLLGSGRNWRSFSRNLASTLSTASPPSEWRMVLVDLRNHGKSAEVARMEPPHDMFNAAKDLADLVNGRAWEWPDVFIGHSLAGKVALQFALSCENGDYGESVKLPKQAYDVFQSDDPVSQEQKSELDIYLHEPSYDRRKELDILEFWKSVQYRYPKLSRLVRDVLTVPLTTVASESAFSSGGRTLDKYRNCLLPDNVEALVCCRDWLLASMATNEAQIDAYKSGVEEVTDELLKIDLNASVCDQASNGRG